MKVYIQHEYTSNDRNPPQNKQFHEQSNVIRESVKNHIDKIYLNVYNTCMVYGIYVAIEWIVVVLK